MSHHDHKIPLSVIDPSDDGDGEIEVSFDWTPGQAASGHHGPPEDYDPGSGDEFYIVSVSNKHGQFVGRDHDDAIIAYLDENWDRPDRAAEEADYRYEEYRDRMMEDRDD